MTPLTFSARLRIIAEAKRRGRAEGRYEAALEFEGRLAKLEREMAEVRESLAREPTQRLERPHGANGG
jgi:flagellar biosynthesis/type III secretory pathway protein FliH